MGNYKYEPLRSYLQGTSSAVITLHFDQISEILGSKLPPCLSGKDYRKKLLWNNNIRNYATRSWLEAGYVFVSTDASSVTFRKDASEAKMYLGNK